MICSKMEQEKAQVRFIWSQMEREKVASNVFMDRRSEK